MKKNAKKFICTTGQTKKNPSRRLRNIDRIWIVAIAIAVISFLLYLPALQNGFLVNWDDDRYLLENPHIKSLNLDFFRWALLDYKTNLWHPVTWFSHALDYAIWQLNPFGHHLTSIMLHAVNTGIVVLLINRLILVTGDSGHEPGSRTSITARTALIASAVTGLLFGIHPLHAESVAWATERKDLLYSLFYMLSISCYIRYVTSTAAECPPRNFLMVHPYQTSLLLFLIAIASKPMAVTLPVVLLLLDWYPLQRIRSRAKLWPLLLEKLPYFLLSAAVSMITILAQQEIGGLKSLENAPPLFRILLAMKSLMLYIVDILLPVNLLPVHFYPKDHSIWKAEFAIAAGFIVAVAAACIVFRKRRVIAASLLFFVISLFPVLGLAQAGVQSRADRFLYLAVLGPFLLIGLFIANHWSKSDNLTQLRIPVRTALVALMLTGSLLLSHATIQQIDIWKDGVAFWGYAIAKSKSPESDLHIFRGAAFEKSGLLDNALADYAKAIEIDPRNPLAYFNRGIHYMGRGLFDSAIDDFNRILKLTPNDMDIYINRGNAFLKKGDAQSAISDYTHAIEKKANSAAVAYVNRSNAYANRGDFGKAIQDVTTAISLNKELLSMYVIRGNLNMKVGNFEQGMKDYKTACDKGWEEGCRKAVFPF